MPGVSLLYDGNGKTNNKTTSHELAAYASGAKAPWLPCGSDRCAEGNTLAKVRKTSTALCSWVFVRAPHKGVGVIKRGRRQSRQHVSRKTLFSSQKRTRSPSPKSATIKTEADKHSSRKSCPHTTERQGSNNLRSLAAHHFPPFPTKKGHETKL